MCVCGRPWSRQCQWDQITKPFDLDTRKLTNDVQINRQIIKDQNNYYQIEHRPVNSYK